MNYGHCPYYHKEQQMRQSIVAFCTAEDCQKRLLCLACTLDFHQDHAQKILKIGKFKEFVDNSTLMQSQTELIQQRSQFIEIISSIYQRLRQMEEQFCSLVDPLIIHPDLKPDALIDRILEYHYEDTLFERIGQHMNHILQINDIITELHKSRRIKFINDHVQEQKYRDFYLRNSIDFRECPQDLIITSSTEPEIKKYGDHSIYFGQLQGKLRHGRGIIITKLHIFEGIWNNDVIIWGQKSWFQKDKDLYIVRRARIKDGLLYGPGEGFASDGSRFKGDLQGDQFNGQGRYSWIDKNYYEGEWANDKRQGKGVFHWNSGERYEGHWFDDKREGYGVYHWSTGDKYEGYWSENMKNGRGVYIYPDGSKEEGQYEDDLSTGEHQFFEAGSTECSRIVMYNKGVEVNDDETNEQYSNCST